MSMTHDYDIVGIEQWTVHLPFLCKTEVLRRQNRFPAMFPQFQQSIPKHVPEWINNALADTFYDYVKGFVLYICLHISVLIVIGRNQIKYLKIHHFIVENLRNHNNAYTNASKNAWTMVSLKMRRKTNLSIRSEITTTLRNKPYDINTEIFIRVWK